MRVNETFKWGDLVEDHPNFIRVYFESRDEYKQFKTHFDNAVKAIRALDHNKEVSELRKAYLDITVEAPWRHWFDGGAWKKRKQESYDAYIRAHDKVVAEKERIFWSHRVSFIAGRYEFYNWLIIPDEFHFCRESKIHQTVEVFTDDYILLASGRDSRIEYVKEKTKRDLT